MTETRYTPLDEDTWRALLRISRQAGETICAHYRDPSLAGELRQKADESPLTKADLASHQLLVDGLGSLTPSLPVLSEESDEAAIASRHQWGRFWMVDPLDGTREFLERTGEFTINIALIDGQRAVAGLIYQPLMQRAFFGALHEGARCARWDDGRWRYEPLKTASLGATRLVLLASRRHRNARLQRTLDFLSADRVIERLDSGSALKFCELAAGRGDCYPRFSPCSEWDVAAGDALVTAAGGAVLGLDGMPLRYNARDTLLAEPFIGFGDRASPLWKALLNDLQQSEPRA